MKCEFSHLNTHSHNTSTCAHTGVLRRGPFGPMGHSHSYAVTTPRAAHSRPAGPAAAPHRSWPVRQLTTSSAPSIGARQSPRLAWATCRIYVSESDLDVGHVALAAPYSAVSARIRMRPLGPMCCPPVDRGAGTQHDTIRRCVRSHAMRLTRPSHDMWFVCVVCPGGAPVPRRARSRQRRP